MGTADTDEETARHLSGMFRPRIVTLLALLALLPVATYLVFEASIVAIAAVNVLIIAGSLWYAFGGGEADTGTGTGGHTG